MYNIPMFMLGVGMVGSVGRRYYLLFYYQIFECCYKNLRLCLKKMFSVQAHTTLISTTYAFFSVKSCSYVRILLKLTKIMDPS